MKRRLFRFKIVRWLIRKFKLVVLPALIVFLLVSFNASLRFTVSSKDTPINKVKTHASVLVKENGNGQAAESKPAIILTHRAIGEDTVWTFTPQKNEEYQKYLRLVDLIDSSKVSASRMGILGAYRVVIKSSDVEVKLSFSESETESSPALRNFVMLMKQFGTQEIRK